MRPERRPSGSARTGNRSADLSTFRGLGSVYGVIMQRGGDGFEEFFRAMIGRVIHTVGRVERDPGLAEDAAVEAMARAHLHWHRIGADPHREAWVLRVAVNAAIDQGRRNRRRRELTESAPLPVSTDEGVVDQVWVADKLRRLPRRQREAIVLRYLADLPERDVAEAMGISVGSVKVHVHRGLRALGASMGDDDEKEVTDVRG